MKVYRRVQFAAFAVLGIVGNSVLVLAQTPDQPLEERLSKIETAAASEVVKNLVRARN